MLLKKILVFLIGCCFSFSICCAPVKVSFREKQEKDVFVNGLTSLEFYESVVRVSLEIPEMGNVLYATAFAIDEHRLLTAAHFCASVVSICMDINMEENITMDQLGSDGRLYWFDGLSIVKLDEKKDLCILEKENHGLKPVVFAENYENIKVGDNVFTIGGPKGVFPIYTEGRVVSLDSTDTIGEQYGRRIIVSAPIWGGNSGGPIFSQDGKVISVVIMGTDYSFINIGVHIEDILSFLNG